jgi:hypothetical protein
VKQKFYKKGLTNNNKGVIINISKERKEVKIMWKSDLILALEKWDSDLLIDSIRINSFGEMVIEATNHHFYIYRDEKWTKFK